MGHQPGLDPAWRHREGPDPDPRRHAHPRLPDNDRTLFSIGATWHATDAFSVDAAYQRINIKTPSIDAFTSLGTELTGKFSGHADLFGVSAQYRF